MYARFRGSRICRLENEPQPATGPRWWRGWAIERLRSVFTGSPVKPGAGAKASCRKRRFQSFLPKGFWPGLAWAEAVAATPPFFFLFQSAFGFFFSLLLLI